ncbi:hypothetical protein E2C01_019941 [Portunus trituberculatus]|uniref:Uncharacterized protein n=1 Tax=Portunus trituberculatus TaxID=210409 RepID=A0A5B7DYS2_PORTR|nr:hypothetical protein [Portunus trituberculatus]
MQKRAICIVEASGAPDTKPQKVKVWVQKTGRWWQCLPRPVFKKVAAFRFHWLDLWHQQTAYTTLPAEFDLASLQKANARSGDALVKMVVTLSYGKATTTEPVAEFLRGLGEEGPRGFVLQLSIAQGDQQPKVKAEESEAVQEQEEVEECEPPLVFRTSVLCKCEDCVLPFWRLLRAYEPRPPKPPPTAMDTYVDIMATECSLLRKEGQVLLKEKRSGKSELAALQAEMDRMEKELDRAEASLAGAGEAEAGEHLEEEFSLIDDELWELLGDGAEEESSSLEGHVSVYGTEEDNTQE